MNVKSCFNGYLMKKNRPDWNVYFMMIAKLVATRSTCLSRPIGAIIVLNNQIQTTGYNGAAPGIDHCTDKGVCFHRNLKAAKTDKYDFCRSVHAEANAIAQAARCGVPIEGGSIYTTLAPCYTCSKLIASAGIKKLFYETEYLSRNKIRDDFWKSQLAPMGIECKCINSFDDMTDDIISLMKPTSIRRL